ncbi:uncharacterized protein PgNI_00550 [Pyricularia grisea]|uniref:Uncharacterized protein n=1 Tax=Pyricularia grisea TaxID=148305 RepID=A0A6P8BGR4_PYRGI|nr:uncharacterized protein PgNI_00550 [Pyricularia grisea]TLD15968.1 hypothetical protein PgNI_00550 [Pyricularia grisea]
MSNQPPWPARETCETTRFLKDIRSKATDQVSAILDSRLAISKTPFPGFFLYCHDRDSIRP